jgi:hypothetical protein
MGECILSRRLLLSALVLLLLPPFQNCSNGFKAANLSSSSSSSSSNVLSGVELYQQQSLTLLSNNCKACHADQSLGGVTRILDVNHLLDSQLIVPGQPESSPLFRAIESNRMPPNQPMSDADKRSVKNWILGLGGLGPDAQPLDLRFSMTLSTDPLPFQTRFAKISRLPNTPASIALDPLRGNRILLGDYDFAAGIVPKFSWEASDIKNWQEAVLPVCASNETKTKYPWPAGMPNFLMATVGRAPSAVESQILSEIDALAGISAGEKFEIFCLTTVSSMEYVAK